jgi:acyl-CoA synthetase (AMP-forming)/AMP-acid ligase II
VSEPTDTVTSGVADPAAPTAVRTVPRLVRASARTFGGRPAVIDGEVVRTFAELADDALLAARGLTALGVRPGDRVGLWAANSHRWVTASLGILTAGATVVPLNTRYRGAEARQLLSRTQARALVVDQGFLGYDHIGSLFGGAATEEAAGYGLEHLALAVNLSTGPGGTGPTGRPAGAPGIRVASWAELTAGAERVPEAQALATADAVRPGDLSEIIFTSGTTGASKGVQLAHGAPIALYSSFGRIWGLRPGDRYLINLPFFHTGGNKAGMMNCLLHGATMVPMAVFDPVAAMELIEGHKITVMNAPPTVYTSILDHPERGRYDLGSLRVAATGAAVVPQRLVERARTELPFQNFITAYGLTECAGTATMCRADDPDEVVTHTNGAALPGVELRILGLGGAAAAPGEPGEVLVRGPNVTTGYWQDPDATKAAIDADGWLHTGDIGSLDGAGHLRITDRLKDLFIVGGFNVSPAEVEQVLARHPDVSEVAVIGVPDARLGEVARAYVIPKPGSAPGAEQVIAWCRERLANFKAPRSVLFVGELPRNASGKVLRRELRARLHQVGQKES